MFVRRLLIIRLFVGLIGMAMVQPAWGNLKAINDDLSEIELEQEVEDQELFDEYRMAQEEESYRDELKTETKTLRKNINQLSREKRQAERRHKRLEKRRKASEKVRNRVSNNAAKVRVKRDRQVEKVEKLQSQVDRIESDAIAARDQKTSDRKELAKLAREERRLKKRLKNAKRIVNKHNKTLKRLRAQKRLANKKNANLRKQVRKMEKQAIAKRDQARDELSRH